MEFGRYYEEFEIGAVYKHWPGRTITEYDNTLFSLLSMNQNPLFIDEHYASGIAAEIKPAPGLPGDVYAIGVYVPDLGKLTRSSNQNVTMFVGPAESQIVTLWVK